MRDLIGEVDAVAAIDDELAELRDRQAAYLAKIRALSVEYEQALAEWQTEATAARDAGEPTPRRRPDPPVSSGDHEATIRHYDAERLQLNLRRERAIASALDQIVQSAQSEVDDALADVAEPVAAVQAAAQRIQTARAAVLMARRTTDNLQGMRRELPRADYGPLDLIDRGGDHPLQDVAPRTPHSVPDSVVPEPSAEERKMAAVRETGIHANVRRAIVTHPSAFR